MQDTAQVNNPPEVTQPIQSPIENTIPVKIDEKPKKNSGLALILSFTTIIATLIAGFFYFQNMQLRKELQKNLPSSTPTPTPDETADWQTYTNELFTIKLPLEFKKIENSPNPIQFINYSLDETDGRGYDPLIDKGELKVEIYTSNTSNLDTYVQEEKQQNIELYGSDSDFITENIIVDLQPAKKISTRYPGYHVAIKHPSENKVITISFGLSFENYLELSNQILNTFKFNTNKINSFLYKNTDLGFSLNIPNIWKDKYKTTTIYSDDQKEVEGVVFEYLPTDIQMTSQKIFSVGRMTLDDWNKEIKITSMPHISEEQKIINSKNFVYYRTFSLENPYSGLSDSDLFGEMSSQISLIISSFKLIE